MLDVAGVVNELSRLDYNGWLMCEQDTTWRPPAESVAISRAVLGYAIRLSQVDRRSVDADVASGAVEQ